MAYIKTTPFTHDNSTLSMKGMQLALRTRSAHGFNVKSPICIYKLCELNNVIVRFNDINMEGMYDRSPKPRIHLSALRPHARRAFTCAHELGHHLFGHGSTIDELQTSLNSPTTKHANEILADSFAAFTLMPTLGIKEAFSIRNINPKKASAREIFSIACNFGVGQSTLVNHLAYTLNWIPKSHRDFLGKITPKMIRTEILGVSVSDPLTYIDSYSNASTFDIEKGGLVLLPHGVIADINMLEQQGENQYGKVFRSLKCGITRVAIPGTTWATFIRISPRNYTGLAKYRHLEEEYDE
ncbi:ImmA/IrrE family metallo-endopeptidase [Acinetobacter junii]|uniref:ImmA/IrrE family metallo-endopeptidase n=1 Tax=Acinetobacter junii TaxID=40215 RepID=UPI0030A3D9A6